MIKTIALVKRKPGITRDEFVRHYEQVHAPLMLRYFPTVKRYVRNYPTPLPGTAEPDFDCITEFWFEDRAGATKVLEILGDYQTEVGKVFLADEERFQDREKTRSFVVDERISK